MENKKPRVTMVMMMWWCSRLLMMKVTSEMSFVLFFSSCELAKRYKTGADRNRGWGVYVAKQYLLVGYLYSICSVFVQAAWSPFCLHRGVGRGPKPWTLRQAVARFRSSFLNWKNIPHQRKFLNSVQSPLWINSRLTNASCGGTSCHWVTPSSL